MKRTVNFNAGPAALPLPALERARDEFLDFAGSGMSVMEHSHRGKEYEAVHDEAIALMRELLGVPASYEVLLLQGGATALFAQIPMNLLDKGAAAQYLVTGTVTSYEENTSSTGGGLSFKGIGFGGKSTEAYLAVDIRVINTTTGDIDYSRTIEGRSKGGGVAVGVYRGGFGGNLAHEENTPAGKAIRAALVEITDYLDCVMVKRDGCKAEFDQKEQKRRQSDKGAIKLD